MKLENILAKILSKDKPTKEELKMLELWKLESQINEENLKAMTEIWEYSDDFKQYQEFDTDKAWISISSEDYNVKKEKPKWQIYFVTILVLLLMGISVYLAYQQQYVLSFIGLNISILFSSIYFITSSYRYDKSKLNFKVRKELLEKSSLKTTSSIINEIALK